MSDLPVVVEPTIEDKKTAAFSNKKDLGEMDISSSNPTLKVDIGGK